MADDSSPTGTTLRLLLADPGNPSAWASFVDRYGPKIFGWCRRWHLQEADAQDVTQNVLTKLVKQMQNFAYDKEKGGFRAYLKTATHHAWMDLLKRRQRPGAAGTGDSAVHEQIHNTEAGDDLAKAIDQEFERELLDEAKARVQLRVSQRDWAIFTALAFEGRPGKDVAAAHDVSVAAAFMVRSRVQKELKEDVRRLNGADFA